MKKYLVLVGGQLVHSSSPGRFAGWRPGKIFGRLTCRSGRKMKAKNRVFFLTWDDAIAAGYRPCKNCQPQPDDYYTLHRGQWKLQDKSTSSSGR